MKKHIMDIFKGKGPQVDLEAQKKELHKFWRQDSPQGNDPEAYTAPIQRSEFLYNFIKDVIPTTAVICELGCNVGRNLNYLYSHGYTNLIGVEISSRACELMKQEYDVKWEVINKPVEEAIEDIKCDCYFTMAVLEHIPTASEWIFEEMKKAKWIVTIEDELHGQDDTRRHFKRNYKNVFSDKKQIKQENCANNGMQDPAFMARMFRTR